MASAANRSAASKQQIGNDDSVRGAVKRVSDYIETGQTTLREYKKEIELLRQEIGLMENHIATQNDENVKVINPAIIQNFDDLSVAIRK